METASQIAIMRTDIMNELRRVKIHAAFECKPDSSHTNFDHLCELVKYPNTNTVRQDWTEFRQAFADEIFDHNGNNPDFDVLLDSKNIIERTKDFLKDKLELLPVYNVYQYKYTPNVDGTGESEELEHFSYHAPISGICDVCLRFRPNDKIYSDDSTRLFIIVFEYNNIAYLGFHSGTVFSEYNKLGFFQSLRNKITTTLMYIKDRLTFNPKDVAEFISFDGQYVGGIIRFQVDVNSKVIRFNEMENAYDHSVFTRTEHDYERASAFGVETDIKIVK